MAIAVAETTGRKAVQVKTFVEAECANSKICRKVVEMSSDTMAYASDKTEAAKAYITDSCSASKSCSEAMQAGSVALEAGSKKIKSIFAQMTNTFFEGSDKKE